MQGSKKLQEVLEQITNQRQGLLDASSGLSEAQLDYKPAEGEWSIGDILHHMALTDEATAKLTANMLKQAVEKNLSADPTPEASVLGSLDEFTPKIAGGKFQAPERVAPRSHLAPSEAIAGSKRRVKTWSRHWSNSRRTIWTAPRIHTPHWDPQRVLRADHRRQT